jgi:superfamily I DNA/RNA helicase
MFDPSTEQKLILDGDSHALVDAGPGTGKSAMALELTRKIAKTLKKPQKVLFLSFSNAAVNRLAATAGITLDTVKSNLSFMTYHALAWEIVRTHGRLWGLSNRLSVLDEVEFLLAVASTQLKSDGNSYDDFLQFAKANHKISFEIMVPLAIKILKSSDDIRRIESKRFPLIIADEFQDTNPDQWELLKAIGEQSRVIALGDLNQVIYGKDYETAKELFENFKTWKSVQTSPFSRHSYRCKNNHILDFSYDLVNSRTADMRNSTVQVRSCYRHQLRTMVATTCAPILRTSQAQGKSIGILTGSAAVAQKLAIDLKIPPEGSVMQMPIHAKIPVSEARKESFRLAALSLYQFKKTKNEKNLVNAARALMALKTNWAARKLKSPVQYEDVIKELSPPKSKRSKKPIYDLVMSEVYADFKSFESIFKEALQNSSLFSSAGESIDSIGHSLMNSESNLSAQMEFPFDHFRETRTPKGLYGDTVAGGRVEILSMWKSKGREFDHVIIVFDPRDFSQNVSVETEKRLFYVACTRAKEWLGIIYPTGSPGRVLAQTLGLR